jgi:hypothetical protein
MKTSLYVYYKHDLQRYVTLISIEGFPAIKQFLSESTINKNVSCELWAVSCELCLWDWDLDSGKQWWVLAA